MAERRQRCGKLEKQKYWTEFEPTRHQFFKIMLGNFRNELMIPTKFIENFREGLSETIHLIGPSGHVWPVTLARIAEDVLFQNGWKDFVQDHHSLEEGDFLIFRYNGNSSFNVTIFNPTGCEREDSYFIKNHLSPCSAVQRKPKHTSDNKAHIDNGGPMEGKVDGKRYSFYLVSNRRQVSQGEKKMAIVAAKKHSSTRPSFMIVMKTTNVSTYFLVNIPKKWAMEHVPHINNLQIQLRVPPGKKTWPVLVKNNQWRTALTKGWCKFVDDNNLEVGDVCIFELKQGGKASKRTIIFDVIIFRVVDELVPLTPQPKPSNKRQNMIVSIA